MILVFQLLEEELITIKSNYSSHQDLGRKLLSSCLAPRKTHQNTRLIRHGKIFRGPPRNSRVGQGWSGLDRASVEFHEVAELDELPENTRLSLRLTSTKGDNNGDSSPALNYRVASLGSEAEVLVFVTEGGYSQLGLSSDIYPGLTMTTGLLCFLAVGFICGPALSKLRLSRIGRFVYRGHKVLVSKIDDDDDDDDDDDEVDRKQDSCTRANTRMFTTYQLECPPRKQMGSSPICQGTSPRQLHRPTFSRSDVYHLPSPEIWFCQKAHQPTYAYMHTSTFFLASNMQGHSTRVSKRPFGNCGDKTNISSRERRLHGSCSSPTFLGNILLPPSPPSQSTSWLGEPPGSNPLTPQCAGLV
ncbi:hypothetical protein RRG08_053235 [Elysia crispata]|uniref:Uncharacterized protein n=1 Tax=Elysia crispata TaxID=231223 RepID=A0AAE1APJ3_9GAST|nr:hypothetical protein RRG08_053235 [Elysia crispata]